MKRNLQPFLLKKKPWGARKGLMLLKEQSKTFVVYNVHFFVVVFIAFRISGNN